MRGTVVAIHGMFCGGWVWERYVPVLEARGFRVITPTLRHHDAAPGDPPPPELGRTGILDYATDLEALVRELPEPPVLVGHSMGGLLALILAERGLARAAALLTPACPAGILALSPAVLRAFAGILATPGFWRRPVRPGYRAARHGFLLGFPDERSRRAVHERLVHESGRAVFEIGLWPLDRRRAARVRLDAVQVPTLVVGARRDHATPAFAVRALARRLPAARHVEVDMAHWVPAEPGWERVAALLADWLEQV